MNDHQRILDLQIRVKILEAAMLELKAAKHDIGLECDRCNVMWAGEDILDALRLGWTPQDQVVNYWCPDCAKSKAAGEDHVETGVHRSEPEAPPPSTPSNAAPSVVEEYERARMDSINGGQTAELLIDECNKVAKVIEFYRKWAGAMLSALDERFSPTRNLDDLANRARAAGIEPGEEPK